ncbi:MAG: hypothetical protein FWF85_09610 [Clostridiales bacterium]|nr:hypothetical protein [Clostridiales bacterium]
MPRQALPLESELWKKHESIYIEVFSLALQILASSPCDISNENIISEALCPILESVGKKQDSAILSGFEPKEFNAQGF